MNAVGRVTIGVVTLAAIVSGAATVHSNARAVRPPQAGFAPVRAVQIVCPHVSGAHSSTSSSGTTDMTVAAFGSRAGLGMSYAPLLPAKGVRRSLSPKPTAVVHQTTPLGAVSVDVTGDGAAGTVVSQVSLTPAGRSRSLSDVACSPVGTDWWFAGGDGRIGATDTYYLLNPSDTPANVTLSLWTERGPASPPGANGITVPPHTTIAGSLADLAPDAAGISVHVHANVGTVAAALFDAHLKGTRPAGADWIAPTAAPSRRTVVTGFVPNATSDVLFVTNPGDQDATVMPRVVTPTRNFEPAGHQSVVVPAGRTAAIDLGAAISGEAATVTTTSDVPVIATGRIVLHPSSGFDELAWLPAQSPLQAPAGIAANSPPFGQQVALVMAAPQDAATVSLRSVNGRSATVHVPAGRTILVDLRALLHGNAAGPGAIEFTATSGGPVYAIRLLHALGAHGPLVAVEVPSVLPSPTRLPPVEPDLRAATP